MNFIERPAALAAADGQRDENDLRALDQHSVEGGEARQPIETTLKSAIRLDEFAPLFCERRVFIAQSDGADRSQDRLAQPP